MLVGIELWGLKARPSLEACVVINNDINRTEGNALSDQSFHDDHVMNPRTGDGGWLLLLHLVTARLGLYENL